MRANPSLFQRSAARARRTPTYDFPAACTPPSTRPYPTGRRLPLASRPAQLVLPLNMHLGAPARPLVAVGDRVLKGEMLAEPAGAASAALHAPTLRHRGGPGAAPDSAPSGMDALCIVLEPDGEDPLGTAPSGGGSHPPGPGQTDRPAARRRGRRSRRRRLPTSVKVNLGDHQRVEQLIINAVECEPYITADDRLMRERADEIVLGIQILQYLLNPHDTLIGIEDNKPEATRRPPRRLRGQRRGNPQSGAHHVPSGGEKQLIQLAHRQGRSPAGRIPAQCGVVCQRTWAPPGR